MQPKNFFFFFKCGHKGTKKKAKMVPKLQLICKLCISDTKYVMWPLSFVRNAYYSYYIRIKYIIFIFFSKKKDLICPKMVPKWCQKLNFYIFDAKWGMRPLILMVMSYRKTIQCLKWILTKFEPLWTKKRQKRAKNANEL